MRGPENEVGLWRHVARDAQIEMFFDVDFTRHRNLEYRRLHFSTTSPKRDRNEDDDHWNFLRLQIWPAEDIANRSAAVTDLDVPHASSRNSSGNEYDYDLTIENMEDALSQSLILGGTDGDSDESAPSRKNHRGLLSRSNSTDFSENNDRYRPRSCARNSDSDKNVSTVPEEDSTGSILSQKLTKEWLDRCQKLKMGNMWIAKRHRTHGFQLGFWMWDMHQRPQYCAWYHQKRFQTLSPRKRGILH